MALQYSSEVRTAKQATIETTIGTAPVLEMWSGSPPAGTSTASSGTLLATGSLPSDWLAAAASGAVSKTGTWTTTGVASGAIGYFRIFAAGSPSLCHIQGTVTATGGGGDMTVDNTSVASLQVITVSTFTLTAANS
jgi:hypothetical protein